MMVTLRCPVLILIYTHKIVLKMQTTNNRFKIHKNVFAVPVTRNITLKTNKQDQIITLSVVLVHLGHR